MLCKYYSNVSIILNKAQNNVCFTKIFKFRHESRKKLPFSDLNAIHQNALCQAYFGFNFTMCTNVTGFDWCFLSNTALFTNNAGLINLGRFYVGSRMDGCQFIAPSNWVPPLLNLKECTFHFSVMFPSWS
jgi:hypothetical protein